MREMRQKARQVTDREIICAMLDGIDTIHLGIHDQPFPYVVPLNFGYEFGDVLTFYFHCAHRGYKRELLERDPHVCVTASRFIAFENGSVKGHLHDYRSVIARGVARRIDPEREAEAFERAHALLLLHNGRSASEVHTTAMRAIELYRIDCLPEDVTAKAEMPPRRAEEVPLVQREGDGIPLDESHILNDWEDEMKKGV